MRPKIGLTTSYQNPPGLSHSDRLKNYLSALTFSGADIFMIHPTSKQDFSFLHHLNGILLSGGGDIPPHFWGEKSSVPFDIKDEIRASFEINLIHKALEAEMPILGICLGLQTINVAFGGTLFTEFPDLLSKRIHCQQPNGLSAYHSITIKKGSNLSEIFNENTTVNSRHHESIKDLASGFLASSKADDGTIESIEFMEKPWIFGVQWHPEDLMEDVHHQKLFKHFISKCKKS